MQTQKFIPNVQAIERRKNIKPFGEITKEYKPKVTRISFTVDKEGVTIVSTPQKTYSVSLLTGADKIPETKPTTISVKISNFPLDMDHKELSNVVRQHSSVYIHRLNLIRDRETGSSRGFAFAVVDDKEEAARLIKDLRCVIIDSLVLSAELAKS